MEARDMTPTTITLDRARPYRAHDADTVALWAGPGEAVVPRWVAEVWGFTPQPRGEPAAPETMPDLEPEGVNELRDLGLNYLQKQTLVDAGYTTRAALAAASDDELIALSGIGKVTVATLRTALDEESVPAAPSGAGRRQNEGVTHGD